MDNTPPAIRILPAEVEDASALALVKSDAYSRDPVTLCLMGEQTPEGIEHRAKELAEGIAKKDPKTHYIKAVLGEDTVIGLGIWHFYLDEESSKSRVVDLDQKEWGPGANADACREFFGRIFKMRERMCGQRHVVLGCLATKIAHQGLGAGSAMLQYGVDIADKENIPGWLEASLEGHNLYKKFGFQRCRILYIGPEQNWRRRRETYFWNVKASHTELKREKGESAFVSCWNTVFILGDCICGSSASSKLLNIPKRTGSIAVYIQAGYQSGVDLKCPMGKALVKHRFPHLLNHRVSETGGSRNRSAVEWKKRAIPQYTDLGGLWVVSSHRFPAKDDKS
ncbi:predicted protein [Histoplasma capsulatum H143]|uniref:N-acetyltransferase domain-containing protein n=1 Tax=Ajellomyces capsulatus (strain H143) TaxID=544712 RepID=C6HHD3_AJECH|nr:predicted protein [Histoplasma capsulatum H143]